MKKCQIMFSKISLEYLKKLDKSVQVILLKWIKKNLIDYCHSKTHGKAFIGNNKSFWKYRVGNYRLLCNIHDNILILEIGHKSEVYKK